MANATLNLNKSSKSEASKPAKAPADDAKLINNASEGKEDNKKTNAPEPKVKDKAKEDGVIVTYVGNSVWVDAENKVWGSKVDGTNIEQTRKYTKSEYDTRKDLQFMVQYGEMKLL